MNFSKIISKKNKFLLPLSWLYQAGVYCYSFLYNSGLKKSVSFSLPVICVGNIAVGGTGKSPMVELLLRLLEGKYNVATISRGYKRKTKGFIIADDKTTAADIGDEPMQFHSKFSGVTVAVGESRVQAVKQLLAKNSQTDVIILDDAFQHRAISAGLNILLTQYDNLFPQDSYLPVGQLRDLKANYKRADIIVITKCPPELPETEKKEIIKEVKPFAHQVVLFAALEYQELYNIFNHETVSSATFDEILVVTGIANPKPLIEYFKKYSNKIQLLNFPDHHLFAKNDVELIKKHFLLIDANNKAIITTEKDAMRLLRFRKELDHLLVLAIPVSHKFLFQGEEIFNTTVIKFIQEKKSHNE